MTKLEWRRARARRAARARRYCMWAVIVVGAALLLIGLPWLLWKGPYEIDKSHISKKGLADGSAALVTGLRTAVVAFAAALGAGVALLYTARTYRLTRRGQITDRFTKALERLGSNEIYVRIGGILALEQIVQDAPEQAATDAARVLGHFIRHRAPRARPEPDPSNSEPYGATPDRSALPPEPASDVQAALTALTRTESRTHVDPREPLDLQGLHLAGAHLNQADLTHADLRGTMLARADLSGATLTRAFLRGATLTEAYLADATLTKADLVDATLTGAFLSGATLTEANLRRATLTETDLSGATLTEATLSGATLTETDLSEATLTEANLSGATLAKADLRRATLEGTVLERADLSRAKNLLPEQISSASTDAETRLPVGFKNCEGAAQAS
ncbi:pentapeptide repeat-containing protein [Streptomyces cellulosae]